MIKRIMIIVCIFASVSTVYAWDDDSDYGGGDNGENNIYADATLGIWYTKWYPFALDFSDDFDSSRPKYKNKVGWSILKDISVNVRYKADTNIFIQYISDKIFNSFESNAEKQMPRKEKELAKIIKGNFDKVIKGPIRLYGRMSYGQFFGNINTPGNFGYARYNTTSNSQAGWYTTLMSIDFGAGFGSTSEESREGKNWFMGLGAKYLDYKYPWMYTIRRGYDEGFLLADSVSKSLSAGYFAYANFPNDDGDSFYLSLYIGFGKADITTDYFNTSTIIGTNDFEFRYNWNLLDTAMMKADIYLGFRYMTQQYLGQSCNFTAKKQFNTYQVNGETPNILFENGDSGECDINLIDIFFGPEIGFIMRF